MCANLALSKMISKEEYKYSKRFDTTKQFNHTSLTLSPVPAESLMGGWQMLPCFFLFNIVSFSHFIQDLPEANKFILISYRQVWAMQLLKRIHHHLLHDGGAASALPNFGISEVSEFACCTCGWAGSLYKQMPYEMKTWLHDCVLFLL